MKIRNIAAASMVAMLALGLSGCVANNASDTKASGKKGDGVIQVVIKDDSCKVSTNTVPSGVVKFSLKNEGTVRNEFEILAPDKLRIVGERENLGPGTTTEYTISLEEGKYFTACKKNMVGALVGAAEFTVTKGKEVQVSADFKKQEEQAVTNYTAYVRDQAGQLLTETKKFAEAFKKGDDATAKKLYAPTRMHYERIEPTAEAFGDLDPALDEREADYQEDKDKGDRQWTGWHVAEKYLWPPAGFTPDKAKRAEIADKLVKDTQALYDEVYSDKFKVSLDDISNGAIGLLEEVATSKITGEEEAFSHTDLYDFQANVEGAKVAYGNVEAIAKKKDPQLAEQIDKEFKKLDEELAKYKKGDGYESYDKLSDEQTKALSDRVNALRAVLAKLTEAILGGK